MFKKFTFRPIYFPAFSDFAEAAHRNSSFILDKALALSPLTLSFFSNVLHFSLFETNGDSLSETNEDKNDAF